VRRFSLSSPLHLVLISSLLQNYATRYFGQIDVVVSAAGVGKSVPYCFDKKMASVLLEERFTPSQGQLEVRSLLPNLAHSHSADVLSPLQRPRIDGMEGDLAGLAFSTLAFPPAHISFSSVV
jgi:hypothetical protein